MNDILIVEDNIEIAKLLNDFLVAEGYIVSIANTGEKALSILEKYGARLIVLDIMLPGIDGFAVVKKVREKENTPIIIVSAKVEHEDKLNGILLGADDYIEKPYDVDILIAKIKNIFKQRYQTDTLVSQELVIDKVKRIVKRKNQILQMTIKEYELLVFLIENKNQTLSKNLLFNKIWGFDSFSENQTLTVHIKWLREKIEDDPKKPKHIITIWGIGYRYEE